MKLEVGMYVRTDKGYIGEITYCRETAEMVSTDIDKEYLDVDYGYGISFREITKASHNIIDLIEAGDYVNGLLVTRILEDNETNEKYINLYGSVSEWEEQDIKSIVTSQQFENISYKIGD